jgi:anthranilate phosphoribosyltransferase
MTTVKELLDDVTEQENNEQRIIFVREAAIRIYAANQEQTMAHAWGEAQRLWDNKPEDC